MAAPDPLRDLNDKAEKVLTDAIPLDDVHALLQEAYDKGKEDGIQEAKDTVDHWYEPPEPDERDEP